MYGFENDNPANKVQLRITGVISDFVPVSNVNLIKEGEKIFVKKARSILNEKRIANKRQSLLVNGNQTSGNIFDIKNSCLSNIFSTINGVTTTKRI